MQSSQLRGVPFSATASGTTSATAVTIGTTVRYFVTDISGTSTTAGSWGLYYGTSSGTTVLYQGSGNISTPLAEAIEAPGIGTISFLMNGATSTYANISGYFI